jgi:hypothetical protein
VNYEEYSLQRCNTMQFGRSPAIYRENVSLHLQAMFLTGSEAGGHVPMKLSELLPNYTALQARITIITTLNTANPTSKSLNVKCRAGKKSNQSLCSTDSRAVRVNWAWTE